MTGSAVRRGDTMLEDCSWFGIVLQSLQMIWNGIDQEMVHSGLHTFDF
jgi:hypothetical protein